MEGWGHAAWAGDGAGRSLALQEPAVWATPFPPGPQSPRGSFQLDPPSSPPGPPRASPRGCRGCRAHRDGGVRLVTVGWPHQPHSWSVRKPGRGADGPGGGGWAERGHGGGARAASKDRLCRPEARSAGKEAWAWRGGQTRPRCAPGSPERPEGQSGPGPASGPSARPHGHSWAAAVCG